jgi:hypothetical protein
MSVRPINILWLLPFFHIAEFDWIIWMGMWRLKVSYLCLCLCLFDLTYLINVSVLPTCAHLNRDNYCGCVVYMTSSCLGCDNYVSECQRLVFVFRLNHGTHFEFFVADLTCNARLTLSSVIGLDPLNFYLASKKEWYFKLRVPLSLNIIKANRQLKQEFVVLISSDRRWIQMPEELEGDRRHWR